MRWLESMASCERRGASHRKNFDTPPLEGTVGEIDIFLEEPSWHPIDSVGGGSVRKPVTPCVNAGAGRLERWRCSMRKTLRRKRQSGRGSGCITWGQS